MVSSNEIRRVGLFVRVGKASRIFSWHKFELQDWQFHQHSPVEAPL